MLANDVERVDNGRQVGAPVPLDEIGGIAFELGQLMRRHRQAQNASTAEERGTKHGTVEVKAATSRRRSSAWESYRERSADAKSPSALQARRAGLGLGEAG